MADDGTLEQSLFPDLIESWKNRSIFGREKAPRKGDVLFGADPTCWHLNACIDLFPTGDHYAQGFRWAAKRLSQVLEIDRVGQDAMIYPLMYLYRHYIELRLKMLLKNVLELLDETETERLNELLDGHSLEPLWQNIAARLPAVCEIGNERPIPKEDTSGVYSYIRQLVEHDPDGQRFRYHVSKTGETSLKDTRYVNSRQFAQRMEQLAEYLDGMYYWVSDMVDWQRQAAADAGSYY